MRILKQETNTTADTIITVFQTEYNYIANTVVAYEVNGSTITSSTVTELGGNFIEINPAPSGKLIVTYEYENAEVVDVNSIIPGLAPWDSTKVLKLINLIKLMQDNIEELQLALGARVAKQEFNSWSAVIQQDIENLKSIVG